MKEPVPSLIPANSVSFEYVYVANQRCECGGTFAAKGQRLVDLPSGPVDRIIAHCEVCEMERAFEFDIGSFFGQLDKYGRFQQVDECFREAMGFIRAGRPTEAEESLRRVLDPEEGEPAFAWAHFHLGMVLLMQGRPDEALTHLERAAAIQPLEPDMHEGLAQAYQAAGRKGEGQDHLDQAAQLRARFRLDS